MPPRSAKKAVVRKPSSRAKKSPAPSQAANPPPMEAEASPEAAGPVVKVEVETVKAGAAETPLAVSEKGEVAILEVKQVTGFEDVVVAEETVSEDKKEEKVMEDLSAVEEKMVEGVAPDEKSAEAVGQKVEEESSEKIQESVPGGSDDAPKNPEVSFMETNEEQNQMDVHLGIDCVIKKATQEPETKATGGDGDNNDVNDGDVSQSDDDVQSLYLETPMAERKKQKEFEIFIGGLDKGAVDEDLIKIFGAFGEIQSVRIVRNPITQKSKGYAFVRYSAIEYAKKALTELKDGTEIRGKQVGISATQDNDTLYLGNICKSWRKEKVIETLKSYGVEQIEHIILPEDLKNEGKTRGYAFIEFNSHSDAMAAFQRLRKPDAVFGHDKSAKVAFAQSPMHPSEEVMLQVRTVYLEGIPDSWDEEKIKELCQQYGEVEKVQLFRKSATKRKDFTMVGFSSRENAVACVEGINNNQFGEGQVKVIANLARPLNKARLAKQGARGGFKVSKDGQTTKEVSKSRKKRKTKSKEVSFKGKYISKPQKMEQRKNFKPQEKGSKHKNIAQPAKSHKGKRKGAGEMATGTNERPSKRACSFKNFGRSYGTSSPALENQRASYSENPRGRFATRPTMHTPRYTPFATAYQAYPYSGASGSSSRHSDLDHSGYLPAGKHNPSAYGYDQRRFGAYDSQMRIGSDFAGAVASVQASYHGHSSYGGYEAGFSYTSSGAYSGGSTYAPYTGSNTHAPYRGGSAHAPYTGGSAHAPYTGDSTHAPYTGGSTHGPYSGGSTHAPYTGGSTHAPYTSGSAYAPHGGYYR